MARLHEKFMGEYGFKEGDVVRIRGMRPTGAVLGPPVKSGSDTRIIEIDGRIRHNAKTSLGEEVTVAVTTAQIAREMEVMRDPESEPLDWFDATKAKEDFIRLKSPNVIRVGDLVFLSVRKRAHPFRVMETDPEGFVQITHATGLRIVY